MGRLRSCHCFILSSSFSAPATADIGLCSHFADCRYWTVLLASKFRMSNDTSPLLYQSTPFSSEMIRSHPQSFTPMRYDQCRTSVRSATTNNPPHRIKLLHSWPTVTAKIKLPTLLVTAFIGLCSLIVTASIGLCSSQRRRLLLDCAPAGYRNPSPGRHLTNTTIKSSSSQSSPSLKQVRTTYRTVLASC